MLATSLIRLLGPCPDPKVGAALEKALEDPSPLVRSAAAAGLQSRLSRTALLGLVKALADDYRLVRVRAAGALAGVPPGGLPPEQRAVYDRAMGELETAVAGRPDMWSSHYNLGNLREQQGDLEGALAAYRKASALRPDVVQPHVNAAMVLARLGKPGDAESALRAALAVDADRAAAHYNLGLLRAERGKADEPNEHLEAALEADPNLAAAAYNLAAMAGEADLEGAVRWAGKAYRIRKDDPRLIQTYAYFLIQSERHQDAVRVLEEALTSAVVSPELIHLLGETYREQGRHLRARELYTRASADPRLPRDARRTFRAMATQPGPEEPDGER